MMIAPNSRARKRVGKPSTVPTWLWAAFILQKPKRMHLQALKMLYCFAEEISETLLNIPYEPLL